MLRLPVSIGLLAAIGVAPGAAYQTPDQSAASFEVVSIKQNTGNCGGSSRTLPDGTFLFNCGPIFLLIPSLSPVPASEVIGVPNWAYSEKYTVVAKPPAGVGLERQKEMMRSMFADRMKFVAHLEEQERDTFALIAARSDRLGPQIEPSAMDCDSPGTTTDRAPGKLAFGNIPNRCGVFHAQGRMTSRGATMSLLAAQIKGEAGRLVIDRTGLSGNYAFLLLFTPPSRAINDAPADSPDFFTALEEQLGLKLRSERTRVPIFVIDHLERPTSN